MTTITNHPSSNAKIGQLDIWTIGHLDNWTFRHFPLRGLSVSERFRQKYMYIYFILYIYYNIYII